jgi:hypothetical protein
MIFNIDKALEKKRERNWPKLFWAIDVHGVLFKSTYSKEKDYTFYNWEQIKFLQFLSDREDCSIILWTSSYCKDVTDYLEVLRQGGINIDHVNENPECPSNELSDFDSKFYFDILLDDKAGFDPNKHWKQLYNKIGYIKRKLK